MRTQLLTALLAAAGVAGTSTAGLASSRAAGGGHSSLTRCYTNQLAVSPGASSGATGHLAIMFKLHSKIRVACAMYGYPGARLLDSHRRNLPTHVIRGTGYIIGNPRPSPVVLKAGATAYFAMEWEHIPTGNQGCPTAPYIRITPPNDYSSELVHLGPSYGIDACGGIVRVTPVQLNKFPL
jgi:hypothetical protein